MTRKQRRSAWGIAKACAAFALCGCLTFVPSLASGDPLNLDSIKALPCVPEWAIYGEALDAGSAIANGIGDPYAGCPPLFEAALTEDHFAYHFDEERGVTELYVGDYWGVNGILKHEIDAFLNHEVTVLPVPYGRPWLAVDLDLDGNIELVIQRGDPGGFGGNGYLDIISAPDWELRAHFVFPGMKIYMRPIAVNADQDPFLELYFTPNGFGSEARAVLVDFDPQTATFRIAADIPAPTRTGGQSAGGDFDGDGRVEFISGNGWGYALFEYDGSVLTHIGQDHPG